MNIDYIYNECKERMSPHKGTWAYDDYFIDDKGKQYFIDTLLSEDNYINCFYGDDAKVDYICDCLNENLAMSQFEQSMNLI